MFSKERIESIIETQGLLDYKWINPKDIVVAHWVRVKCTFGCPDYGSGTCPPNTPSVNDCISFFKGYQTGLIIRITKFADKNSYPSDWSKEMTIKLLDVERKIFFAGYQKIFLLNQTGCCMCSNCSKNRLLCKDKAKSRPSPESFAVDVYQSIINAGMELNVVAENLAEMNRIAILLIE